MKVKRSDTPDGKIELQVTVPVDKVEETRDFLHFQLAAQNNIDPQSTQDLAATIKEKVGEAYYNSFMGFQAMVFLAPFAVTQEKLAIMGNPQVESLGESFESGREFSFRVIATPKPSYEMKDFSPVKIKIPQPFVTEDDIDQQMLNLAESYVDFQKDDDHPVQDGNDVLIALTTRDETGEEIPQLSAESRTYTLGQNFIPGGFDEQLIGMDVGQSKTFDITATEFIRDDSADPDATGTFNFTVTILEIQKRVIPAITDAWVAKNLPTFNNVQELREEIHRQGMEYQGKQQENMKTFAAASEFAKRFEGSIPDEFYEITREEIMNNMQQDLKAQNMTLQEFIKQQPGGEQQFSMQLMMQTREILTQAFTLDALARHLKLEVTPQDIADTFHAMAPGYEQQVRMEFEMTGRMYLIEEGALRAKANQWLVDNAEIEYISAS